MSAWSVWVGLAAGAVAVELATLTAVFGMLAVALAVSAAAAAVGAPLPVQLVLLAGTCGAEFAVLRRWVADRQHQPMAMRSGEAALEGREAVVTHEINPPTGRVRLGGESWAARHPHDQVIPVGTTVFVLGVEGATVLVLPKELS